MYCEWTNMSERAKNELILLFQGRLALVQCQLNTYLLLVSSFRNSSLGDFPFGAL
jgi:hypothetical protein